MRRPGTRCSRHASRRTLPSTTSRTRLQRRSRPSTTTPRGCRPSSLRSGRPWPSTLRRILTSSATSSSTSPGAETRTRTRGSFSSQATATRKTSLQCTRISTRPSGPSMRATLCSSSLRSRI
eukprot:Amastigsp_a175061_33.p5 type:complete len:122 gc:universal Amastigsp_a175061_33:1072-707(-)